MPAPACPMKWWRGWSKASHCATRRCPAAAGARGGGASGGIGGLGLAIAQRVAVLHGGSLRPLPSPGGGTRLCLALPLA